MIGVVMSVEHEPNRFVGCAPDLWQYFPRAPGEVCVDHQDVIVENNPGAVGGPADYRVTLPEEHTRGELGDLLVLASCRGQREKGENGRQGNSFHGCHGASTNRTGNFEKGIWPARHYSARTQPGLYRRLR